MARLLSETTFQESAPSVDESGGILRGVKLLGKESKNGRRYSDKALAEAVKLYDDRKIFVNHPKRSETGEDRQFESWAGVSRNPQLRSDGIYGDVHLRRKSDYFEGILEAAQRFPKSIGFSHVADGDSSLDSHGTEIVESIREVFSIDLVTDPATTNGIFESVKRDAGKHKTKTLRQVIEAMPADAPLRTRLIESMDAGMFDGGATVDTDAASGGDDTDELSLLAKVFQKALETVAAIMGSKAMADAANKPQAPPNQPAATTPPNAEANANPGAAGNPLDANAKKQIESLQRRLDLSDAKNSLIESGVDATEIRVATLANTPAEHRKALLESWPKNDAPKLQESIVGSFWPESSPPANSSNGDKFADADYEKNFWESTKAKK